MAVAVRVIPCLDVDAGRVVKGVNFTALRDAGDPVELATAYDAQGADELTFLDVTASAADRETTFDVVRRTAECVFIPLTVGGGIREVSDVDRLLRAGADKVSINTAAVARPELLREASHRFGAQCIVLSVDARRVPTGMAHAAFVPPGGQLCSPPHCAQSQPKPRQPDHRPSHSRHRPAQRLAAGIARQRIRPVHAVCLDC